VGNVEWAERNGDIFALLKRPCKYRQGASCIYSCKYPGNTVLLFGITQAPPLSFRTAIRANGMYGNTLITPPK
jgi:hypothetical protein